MEAPAMESTNMSVKLTDDGLFSCHAAGCNEVFDTVGELTSHHTFNHEEHSETDERPFIPMEIKEEPQDDDYQDMVYDYPHIKEEPQDNWVFDHPVELPHDSDSDSSTTSVKQEFQSGEHDIQFEFEPTYDYFSESAESSDNPFKDDPKDLDYIFSDLSDSEVKQDENHEIKPYNSKVSKKRKRSLSPILKWHLRDNEVQGQTSEQSEADDGKQKAKNLNNGSTETNDESSTVCMCPICNATYSAQKGLHLHVIQCTKKSVIPEYSNIKYTCPKCEIYQCQTVNNLKKHLLRNNCLTPEQRAEQARSSDVIPTKKLQQKKSKVSKKSKISLSPIRKWHLRDNEVLRQTSEQSEADDGKQMTKKMNKGSTDINYKSSTVCTCPICNATYSTQKSLHLHVIQCTKKSVIPEYSNSKYTCPKCEIYQCQTVFNLKKHLLRNNCLTPEQRAEQARSELGINMSYSISSPKVTISPKLLQYTTKTSTASTGILECRKCDSKFHDVYKFRLHVNMCQNVKNILLGNNQKKTRSGGKFNCRKCNEEFLSFRQLNFHEQKCILAQNHVNKESEKSGKAKIDELQCRYCKILFTNHVSLKIHDCFVKHQFSIAEQNRKNEECKLSEFCCRKCGENFMSFRILNFHEQRCILGNSETETSAFSTSDQISCVFQPEHSSSMIEQDSSLNLSLVKQESDSNLTNMNGETDSGRSVEKSKHGTDWLNAEAMKICAKLYDTTSNKTSDEMTVQRDSQSETINHTNEIKEPSDDLNISSNQTAEGSESLSINRTAATPSDTSFNREICSVSQSPCKSETVMIDSSVSEENSVIEASDGFNDVKKKSSRNKFKCCRCHVEFSYQKSWLKHEAVCNNPPKQDFVCSSCGAKFSYKKAFVRHGSKCSAAPAKDIPVLGTESSSALKHGEDLMKKETETTYSKLHGDVTSDSSDKMDQTRTLPDEVVGHETLQSKNYVINNSAVPNATKSDKLLDKLANVAEQISMQSENIGKLRNDISEPLDNLNVGFTQITGGSENFVVTDQAASQSDNSSRNICLGSQSPYKSETVMTDLSIREEISITDQSDGLNNSRNKSVDKKFRCCHCHVEFSYRKSWLKHEEFCTDTPKQDFICSKCGAKFTHKKAFVKHDCPFADEHIPVVEKPQSSVYNCSKCKEKFVWKTAYDDHVRDCVEQNFHCFNCKQTFPSKLSYTEHVRVCHTIRCKKCNSFIPGELLSVHTCSITNADRSICLVCYNAFPSNYRLQQHMKKCPYSCKKCTLQFLDPVLFSTHVKYCSSQNKLNQDTGNLIKDEKPLIKEEQISTDISCGTCDKKFYSESELEAHVCPTAFKCSNCSARFAYENSHYQHMLTCNVILTTFQCSCCSLPLPSELELREHEQNCPMFCAKCHAMFVDPKMFMVHDEHCTGEIMMQPKHDGHCTGEIMMQPKHDGHCTGEIMMQPKHDGHCTGEIVMQPNHDGHCTGEIMIQPMHDEHSTAEIKMEPKDDDYHNEIILP